MRKASQFHFTSCQRGLSAHAGFQTRATSGDVTPDERSELERRALYQAPRDLAPEPDQDTIDAEFPKSFEQINLTSGRIAVLRSVYVGQDYSGRWGNYFTHGLVFGDSGEHWPVDVCGWPEWQSGLSAEADTTDPEPLPQVELQGLDGLGFGVLSEFLREKAQEDIGLFERMLRAVFARSADSRSLVIREQSETDGLFWIACIQKAFPRQLQSRLPFCTYQFNPGSARALNVTVRETQFLFNDVERNFQFYVFDFVDRKHSTVPEAGAVYAKALAEWMTNENPARIEAFHAFAADFACEELGPALETILLLFEVYERLRTPSPDEIPSLLAFVEKHARSERPYVALLDVWAEPERMLDARTATFDQWSGVITFLSEGAARTGDARSFERAARAWVRAFENLVLERGESAEPLSRLRDQLEAKMGARRGCVSTAFLDWVRSVYEHIDALNARVVTLSPAALEALMGQLERSCRETPDRPSYRHEALLEFVAAMAHVTYVAAEGKRDLEFGWALSPYLRQPPGIEAIVVELGKGLAELRAREENRLSDVVYANACSAIGKALAEALRRAGDSTRYQVLRQLAEDKRLWEVLYREWRLSTPKAADPVAAHEHYRERVLKDGSRYAIAVHAKMASTLLSKLLPEPAQLRAAHGWVLSGYVDQLDDASAERVFELATKSLSLSPHDREGDALEERLQAYAKKNRSAHARDHLALRALAKRLNTGASSSDDDAKLLKRVSDGEYSAFVDALLPQMLRGANNVPAQGEVLEFLAAGQRLELFREPYLRYLAGRDADAEFSAADQACVMFWVEAKKSVLPKLTPLRDPVLDAIGTRIGSLPSTERKAVEAWIRDRAESQNKSNEWEQFQQLVADRKPSMLTRLFGRGKSPSE